MDFFDEAGPSNRPQTFDDSVSMEFLREAGPSSRVQSYDNCIYYNRSDYSSSDEELSDSDPPEIYADRSKRHESIFPGEEYVFNDSNEAEDEAYLECEKPARLFKSLVGFTAHVEGYLKNDNCLTKDQMFAEIKRVRRLLIQNADIFEQMMDFLVSTHLSNVPSVQSRKSEASEDVSSGIYSYENASDSKLIIDSEVLCEKSNNKETVNTSRYNLRSPKPKYSKYGSHDKENADPQQKSKRKSNEKKSPEQKKKNKVKSVTSNLILNPVAADKALKQSKKKKIEVKHDSCNLKGDPDSQNKLVVNLTDILKRLPKKVKNDKRPDPVIKSAKKSDPIIKSAKKSDPIIKSAKKSDPIIKSAKKSDQIIKNTKKLDSLTKNAKKPNPFYKNNKSPTYKISETNVRHSKRPKARRTVYLAGERLYLNASGVLCRIDDVESDTDVAENERQSKCLLKGEPEPMQRNNSVTRNKRKSDCFFKDDAEPIRNKASVNLKGSQSLPIIKKRKLYSPEEWMLSLNEKGIGDY